MYGLDELATPCAKRVPVGDPVPLCLHAITRALNRFSVLAFFTSFTIVAAFWQEVHRLSQSVQTKAVYLVRLIG